MTVPVMTMARAAAGFVARLGVGGASVSVIGRHGVAEAGSDTSASRPARSKQRSTSAVEVEVLLGQPPVASRAEGRDAEHAQQARQRVARREVEPGRGVLGDDPGQLVDVAEAVGAQRDRRRDQLDPRGLDVRPGRRGLEQDVDRGADGVEHRLVVRTLRQTGSEALAARRLVGEEHILLAGEVPVERARRHVDGIGDVVDGGGLVAPRREQPDRRVGQRPTGRQLLPRPPPAVRGRRCRGQGHPTTLAELSDTDSCQSLSRAAGSPRRPALGATSLVSSPAAMSPTASGRPRERGEARDRSERGPRP